MSFLLTNIRSAVDAFHWAERPTDAEVERALRIIDDSGESLGFKKKSTRHAEIATMDRRREIENILRDHAATLSKEQFEQVMSYRKQEEERAAGRRRFFTQLVVSLLVLGFAIGVLVAIRPSPTEQKALFGLVGTVVGYWLR